MTIDQPIHPVILCGGSGTRLWPLSRKARPKPFLPLIGNSTLFEQALDRVGGDFGFAQPIVVAGEAHCALIADQMQGRPHRLLVEPTARNTAPAIALAAAILPEDAVMLVCPSDHHIADPQAFRNAAQAAAQLALQGHLVAFGITPDGPETGYGYIKRGAVIGGGFEIAQFVEKPDLETAEAYCASGDYRWNGGIFAFRAGTLLTELAAHRPAMASAVQAAITKAHSKGSQVHPDAAAFASIEGESIDYAVMENTDSAAMVPVDMGWSDIGNWAALKVALADNGNVTRGAVDLDDCDNVLALSDGPRISAVGLEDICIIVSDGEVLVTTREGAQRVGKLPGASDQ